MGKVTFHARISYDSESETQAAYLLANLQQKLSEQGITLTIL